MAVFYIIILLSLFGRAIGGLIYTKKANANKREI
jgi:hypothetical protein